VGGIIQESLGGIIPLQTGGFAGIGMNASAKEPSLHISAMLMPSSLNAQRRSCGG